MTTIIVVAIVALVFFVAISVAVFMTWRQETQMRTDSLKGIEMSLNEVLGEFSPRRPAPVRGPDDIHQESFERRTGKRGESKRNSRKRSEPDEGNGDYDPHGWADREQGIDVTVFRPSNISTKRSEARSETAKTTETAKSPGSAESIQPVEQKIEAVNEGLKKEEMSMIQETSETSLEENKNAGKGSDEVDLRFIDIDDLFDLDEIVFDGIEHDRTADYNTGKSGRKYTAEELETLIKE